MGLIARRAWWARYLCTHGHHFSVDAETEPEQYVVRCPVCGTTSVQPQKGGANA